MKTWRIILILQLFFFTILSAYQPSDYYPFYTQNQTEYLENEFDLNDQSSLNHSISRRQVSLNILSSQQARIPITPSYIILGPRVVRPDQIVSISVSILRKQWNPITVRALISNDDTAVASAEDLFRVNVPGVLKMRLPRSIRRGTYRLTVEGKMSTGEIKFHNVSQLIFEQKAVSILIQLDRPIFRHETVVQFRCIPIYPDLSGYFYPIDAYIIGPSGHILRKWENQQTTVGMISLEVNEPRKKKRERDMIRFF